MPTQLIYWEQIFLVEVRNRQVWCNAAMQKRCQDLLSEGQKVISSEVRVKTNEIGRLGRRMATFFVYMLTE